MGDITPFVILKLDTERKFKLSNKAFYYFEAETGKSVHEIDFDALSVTEVNQLIYAGLKSQDDSITLETTVNIIDGCMTYEEAIQVIVKALEGSSFLSLKDSKEIEITTF